MEFKTGRTIRFLFGLILLVMSIGLLPVINQISVDFGQQNTFLPAILFLIPFISGIIFIASVFIGGGDG